MLSGHEEPPTELRLVAARVAGIARIPHERHEAFCDDAVNLILLVQNRVVIRELGLIGEWSSKTKAERMMLRGQNLPAQAEWLKKTAADRKAMRQATEGRLKNVEAAVVALRNALDSLTKAEKEYFDLVVCSRRSWVDPEGWPPLAPDKNAMVKALRASNKTTARELRTLALASADLVNKNPNRKGKQENWVDFTFHKFVAALWRCAHEHGGKLSANCKNNVGSGTMFEVFEELRPYLAKMPFGASLIKPVVPVQTIANIVAAERKKAKPVPKVSSEV
jgi:hypothetical protein